LGKLNTKLNLLATEPFPDAGKMLFGQCFEEKINKGMKLPLLIELSQQQMQRNLTTVFSKGGLLQLPSMARGPKTWQMELPISARGRYSFRARGQGRGRLPSDNIKTKSAGLTKRVENQVRKHKTNLTQFQSKCILGKDWATSYKFKPFAISKRLKYFTNDPWVLNAISGVSNLFYKSTGSRIKFHSPH
jgi:hypothetical protein